MDKRAKKEKKKKDVGILQPKGKLFFKVWLIEIRKSPF